MSESVRQSNLFAAEDYKKVFKAYQFIDYTAYDYDTLKQALINYIQTYYPEDFNDYIESSEFIAIIELLAYFGTSLAFRTDLNSRENFIDTAERRESIIRLAQMVNYVPRRNIPASGLFKIAAVQTDQPLVDADGVNLNDVTIYWNDPNNPDWFDQFVQICNAAFSSLNPFGRPTKSGTIGGIPTDLYQLNNIPKLNVTYPVVLNINGQQYPVDICNPDLVTEETIFERHPDPANPFNFIYRNDSLGVGSNNTGFFLYFKQGSLLNIDTNFEFPVPNRVFPIDIQDINQSDVYVQETDEQGNVLTKWQKVPALAGENIIYNSIKFSERNIFDVISGASDTISIRFADGNFGNVPTGLFRTWVRVSANQALIIRPDDAQGLQINIPYIGADNQEYTLRIVFNLEQTISNAAPSETDEQIKLRAPEVFSTQSRMVNGSDYNVLPLVYGNQIAKIQAINRTYSGQSRYIDLNDPTGFHRDLIIFGQDGALYRDNQDVLLEVVEDSTNSGTIESIIVNTIQEILDDPKVTNFFYDEYLPQFESKIRVNGGYSMLDLINATPYDIYWKTVPVKFKNDTGYFSPDSIGNTGASEPLVNTFSPLASSPQQPWGFIKSGSILDFEATASDITVSVNNVVQNGIPLTVDPLNPYASVGPVEFNAEIRANSRAKKVYPPFRKNLTTTEINEITTAVNLAENFWLYYDLLTDEWHAISTPSNVINSANSKFVYPDPINNGLPTELIYSDWSNWIEGGLVYVSMDSTSTPGIVTYSIIARGRVYVFESYRDVRFYWEPNKVVIDSTTGLALEDTIEVMPFVNTNASIDNNNPPIPNPNPTTSFLNENVPFIISGVFVQNDGFLDNSKVEVSLPDENKDGIPDNPQGFNDIVSYNDRVVFEYYYNEVAGYQTTRPWLCKWGSNLETISTDYYVYFVPDPTDDQKLYMPPYIADVLLTPTQMLDPELYTPNVVILGDADLIFLNNLPQVSFNESSWPTPLRTVANQVTAFFNGTDNGTLGSFTTFTWLQGSENISSPEKIVREYFINKSFLISSISEPGYGFYYTFEFQDTENPIFTRNKIVTEIVDKYHFDKNGKVFTQNTTIPENNRLPLYFKWSHYSPLDQRVDPAPTNIVDMIVITDGYYRDVLIWKNLNTSINLYPAPPTTEELRIQFQDLNQYKMVSDSMVWNSGTFKLLFGAQAESELQATFKVVKAPSTNISDNEVKTKVIKAIDTYFDIRNWDFGEKFFYTELAAFIHQQLSKIISSVVIVPNNADSQFGNLFEIVAGPTELFLSTATVNNIQIVSNLTDQNMRV